MLDYTREECNEMLLHVLGDLVVFGPKDRSMGICGNVCRAIESQHPDADFTTMCLKLARDHWTLWEHYSGDRNYPVPSEEARGHHSAESRFYVRDDMWTGAYGAKRWELVEYLIATIKGELGLGQRDIDTTHCVAPIYTD